MTTEHTEPDVAEVAEPIDQGRLEEYLTGTPLATALPIHSVHLIGQGQSNLTFRIQLQTGPVILRRPPMGPLPPRAHDVLREFRVMTGLRSSDVPVPRPLVACDNPAVLGAPFYIMDDLPGDAIRFELPPALAGSSDTPRLIAEGTVDALARLHTTNPDTIGLGNLGKPTGYVARQVRLWKGQLDYARTRPVPNLDWTSGWLERNPPPDVDQPSIVHGDYKLDNVIFSTEPPARILGIVDWEMATLGDPLADLGWLLAFWCENGTPPAELRILPRVTEDPRFPRRAELAARYAECAGRRLPDLRFYIVLALWKMAILLEAHWARHVRGTAGSFDFSYLETGGPALARYVREVAEHGGFFTDAAIWV